MLKPFGAIKNPEEPPKIMRSSKKNLSSIFRGKEKFQDPPPKLNLEAEKQLKLCE